MNVLNNELVTSYLEMTKTFRRGLQLRHTISLWKLQISMMCRLDTSLHTRAKLTTMISAWEVTPTIINLRPKSYTKLRWKPYRDKEKMISKIIRKLKNLLIHHTLILIKDPKNSRKVTVEMRVLHKSHQWIQDLIKLRFWNRFHYRIIHL